MNAINIIRAWKGTSAGNESSPRDGSPLNPAGDIELNECELGLVFGGMRPQPGTNKTDHTCEVWTCTYSPVVCG